MFWRNFLKLRFVPEYVAGISGLSLLGSRLFGVHGVESALVLSLILGPTLLLASAWRRQVRENEQELNVWAPARAAFLRALRTAAIPVAILAINQLRVRQCSPLDGFAFEILGPFSSAIFGASLGTLLSVSMANDRARRFAAFALVLVAAFVGVYEIYATPAVFLFSHLFGYFPGPLYDVGRELSWTLISFRLLTFMFATSAFAAAAFILRFRKNKTRDIFLLVLSLATFSLAFIATIFGTSFGHRSSISAMNEQLGTELRGEYCIARMPEELSPKKKKMLLDDCEFRVSQIAKRLEIEPTEKINAFYYRNAAEKARLLGAGRTFVAKPWRREIHLQLRQWPHPILAHEVVHAVVGDVGSGPFEISGYLGGLIPNPGLIEGLAVAAAWDGRNEGTPHEWAKALLSMKRLPAADKLMSLGFLSLSSREAYSAAGSLLRFVMDSEGVDVVKKAYSDGSFSKSLNSVEKEWIRFLEQDVVVSDGFLARAEQLFSRKSIFSQVCPHVLAKLESEVGSALAVKDFVRADRSCDEMLAIDPPNTFAKSYKVAALAGRGDFESAEELTKELSAAGRSMVSRAELTIADRLWSFGRRPDAKSVYESQDSELLSSGQRRSLSLKKRYVDHPKGDALRDYFLGAPGELRSSASAFDAIAELERIDPSLSHYLFARLLINSDHFPAALKHLSEVDIDALADESLKVEYLRLLTSTFVQLARYKEAKDAALSLKNMASGVSKADAVDWLERIEFMENR